LSGRRLAVVIVVAAALGGCGGCKERAEPLAVRKVLIDVAPGAEAGGSLEREKVRATVEAAIDDDSRFRRTDERDAAVLRVFLEAAALTPGEKAGTAGGSLSVSVEVTGGVPGEPLKRYRYRGHSLTSLSGAAGQPGNLDFVTLFRRAFDDAAGQVLAAKGAQRQDTQTLLTWLQAEGSSTEQRRQAIRVLGARKEPAALQALIATLRQDDRELAQAALGALTLIADPTAAPAVMEYAESQPSLARKQAIEAVRVMGGEVGKAWLFTLSTGHPEADVRATAERALAQLEDRPVDLESTRLAERVDDEPAAQAPQ
jgi:hypothetical protein